MSLTIDPFCGVRFNEKTLKLGRVVSPPYDVFNASLERKLRKFKENAVHLELPAGRTHARYKKSRALWERWLKAGVLVRDEKPSFYVVEQKFKFRGKSYVRTGIMGALGLGPASARRVLRHERTLSKPKADRTRVLKTMKANTSPIFGIYPDGGGRIRKIIAAAKRKKPLSAGKDIQGVALKFWKIEEEKSVAAISRAFRAKSLLIADGHHRFEVARDYWRSAKRKGSGHTLAYLVAEEDKGLIVNPTHRVVKSSPSVSKAVAKHCRGARVASASKLELALSRAKSPYAFGLFNGNLRLMGPASGAPNVKSRFGLDWLSRNIFKSVDPQDMGYYHGIGEALSDAKKSKSYAFIGRPFSVADIRKAVLRAGLLPQKSTYFFPKIGSGLVFRSF
jgi:uncharacterized protein (DUF1015 family)